MRAWISTDLDVYYEDCVIGGPGAFVVPIKEREKFKEATRTKLVLEIAGLSPAPRVYRLRPKRRASPASSASACGSTAGAAAIPTSIEVRVGAATYRRRITAWPQG